MAALIDIVKKGATDRSVTIRIIDSTDGTPETGVVFNTSGIDLWYRREGAAKVSITEADLATPALTDAHADGGFLHIGDGEYRLDLPDAAFATGANHVDIGGTVTGMVVIGGRVRLVDYDPEDTVRLGLTALPNAAADAAGGLPISDAGGFDVDALKALVPVKTTIATLASQTSFTLTAGSADDDAYNGWLAVVHDIASAVQVAVGYVLDYTGSSNTITLAADPGIFTMAAGDNISLIPPASLAQFKLSEIATNNAVGHVATDTGEASAVSGSAAALTAAQAASDVLDEALSSHTTAGSLGKAVADIEGDTSELQADWANGGRLDMILDARASQASVDGLNDIAVADILGATVAEAFSTDGQNPTLAEVLHEIRQTVGDFSVSGTTLTVKKMDGTAAMTFTLDDSDNPTSRTRAT